jgi:uncharacterized membrane protein
LGRQWTSLSSVTPIISRLYSYMLIYARLLFFFLVLVSRKIQTIDKSREAKRHLVGFYLQLGLHAVSAYMVDTGKLVLVVLGCPTRATRIISAIMNTDFEVVKIRLRW